jgi:hypothetical protein
LRRRPLSSGVLRVARLAAREPISGHLRVGGRGQVPSPGNVPLQGVLEHSHGDAHDVNDASMPARAGAIFGVRATRAAGAATCEAAAQAATDARGRGQQARGCGGLDPGGHTHGLGLFDGRSPSSTPATPAQQCAAGLTAHLTGPQGLEGGKSENLPAPFFFFTPRRLCHHNAIIITTAY